VKTLWLEQNKIRTLDNLSVLRNLTCLFMRGNLVGSMIGLSSLQSLQVGAKRLRAVPA
jgi:hypothetical protein